MPQPTKTFAGRLPWWAPLSIARSILLRRRIWGGLLAALAMAVLLPSTATPPLRATLIWNAGGLAYLTIAAWTMATCESDAVRRRAARQDDSAYVILAMILLAIAASFMATIGLLSEAKLAAGGTKAVYVALVVGTLVVSWSVTQIAFTFHYAHEHYAPRHTERDSPAGLAFPKDDAPDYFDFLYFATSIGATSQTSDVAIVTKGLRRLVLIHAVVSFFFNTMVLALMVNLAAGMV